jgi:hypothetical protein
MSTDTLSRRRLLASVPAVAAAMAPVAASALSALPADDDPVFATIEAHRASKRALKLAGERHAYLERTLPRAQRSWRYAIWEPEPPEGCSDAPEWIEATLEFADATELDFDAEAAVLTTQPTTLAGALTLLEYAAQDTGGDGTFLDSASRCYREDVTDAAEAFLPMIAATLRKLIAIS